MRLFRYNTIESVSKSSYIENKTYRNAHIKDTNDQINMQSYHSESSSNLKLE